MNSLTLNPWAIPLGVLLASLVLGYATRILLLRRLARMFAQTETDLDDLFAYLGWMREHKL